MEEFPIAFNTTDVFWGVVEGEYVSLRVSQVCQLLQLLAAGFPNTAEMSHF